MTKPLIMQQRFFKGGVNLPDTSEHDIGDDEIHSTSQSFALSFFATAVAKILHCCDIKNKSQAIKEDEGFHFAFLNFLQRSLQKVIFHQIYTI